MDVSAITSPVASTESLPLSSDCFSSLSSSDEEWMDHDNSTVHTLKKKSKTGRGGRGRGLRRRRGRGEGEGEIVVHLEKLDLTMALIVYHCN